MPASCKSTRHASEDAELAGWLPNISPKSGEVQRVFVDSQHPGGPSEVPQP
jgi:hypothetical protein